MNSAQAISIKTLDIGFVYQIVCIPWLSHISINPNNQLYESYLKQKMKKAAGRTNNIPGSGIPAAYRHMPYI
jgi:hypothetical protein